MRDVDVCGGEIRVCRGRQCWEPQQTECKGGCARAGGGGGGDDPILLGPIFELHDGLSLASC